MASNRVNASDMDSGKKTDSGKKRILILGAGFAGAYTALHLEQHLARSPEVEIVLVSEENFVLFTPMLHEVAGSDVAITDVVQSLRKMLRHTRIFVAEIESIDLVKKSVHLLHPELKQEFDLSYDHLVVAVGSVTNFRRTPGVEEHALTMKTLGDAILVRNRVIRALDLADSAWDERFRDAMLTVLVAGGGFAGAETVGAVNDLMRGVMKFYPNLKEDMLRIILVHPSETILPELGETLGRYAQQKLTERGVDVHLNSTVASYDGQEAVLSDGTRIATRLLIWTAGTTPQPVCSTLPSSIERGHVVANECLQVPGWPGVWALGDCALVPDVLKPGKFCPPTAQHAIRQAKVLANNIIATLNGQPVQPFRFKMMGALATIGRRVGVAEIFGMRFSGIIAWWLWRAIYLSKMPGLPNKVRITIDWSLDLVFSKGLVEVPTLRAPTVSQVEEVSTSGRSGSEIPPVPQVHRRAS